MWEAGGRVLVVRHIWLCECWLLLDPVAYMKKSVNKKLILFLEMAVRPDPIVYNDSVGDMTTYANLDYANYPGDGFQQSYNNNSEPQQHQYDHSSYPAQQNQPTLPMNDFTNPQQPVHYYANPQQPAYPHPQVVPYNQQHAELKQRKGKFVMEKNLQFLKTKPGILNMINIVRFSKSFFFFSPSLQNLRTVQSLNVLRALSFIHFALLLHPTLLLWNGCSVGS